MKFIKMTKSLALTVTSLGLAFGAQAQKNPSVTYIDENGESKTITEYTLIDADQTATQTLNGVYVVGADYDEDGKIDAADALVAGKKTVFTFLNGAGVGGTGQTSAKIVLVDGFSLVMKDTINVFNGSSLAVFGQEKGIGSLICNGAADYAGIRAKGKGASLQICGGRVKATAGNVVEEEDAMPGIKDFDVVKVTGGYLLAAGGYGEDVGPAIVATSLKASMGINVQVGASLTGMSQLQHTSADDEFAKPASENRYARFVTPNYLTFTAEKAGSTIKFAKSLGDNLMINTNGAWVAYKDDDLITLANAGDKVQFKGKGVQTLGEGGKRFAMTGRIGASGSVTSLTDENGGDPDVTLLSSCYAYMFVNCAALTSLPDLPATNLAAMCYGYMFKGCSRLAVNTNATEGSKLWFVPATESKNGWNTCMFKDTAGNFTGDPKLCTAYYVAPAEDLVTVVVPEVEGATAQLFAFDTFGGWAAVATNEVPSNATVRVVWTADADTALTGDDAQNVYQWQAEFGPAKGGETAPAPEVTTGESVVTVSFDTRENKMYFSAGQILPIWYAKGAEVTVKGEGEQEWTALVKNAANTNTVAWKPVEQGVYSLSQTGLEIATITLSTPVEVTTNKLEVEGTTVAVTDEGGQPLVAQTDGEFAGKIIVPSNSVVKVTYTTTNGVYFADGSKTYVQTLTADKAVTDAAAIVKPEVPAAPSVKVGVVAQRYPWDGKLDVQFWAKNTPAGQYGLKVSVTIGEKTDYGFFRGVKSGIDTVEFDLSNFGEVTTKKCKVWAELIED